MNKTHHSLKIVQHNVRGWWNKRFELYNTYRQLNPDLILLNETGQSSIRLPGYKTYTSVKEGKNKRSGYGTAIAIKEHLVHLHMDDFDTDMIAVKIFTPDGPIIIATDYIPPTHGFIHYPDYLKLFRPGIPVYLLGDLNAHHQSLDSGSNSANPIGNQLVKLIERKNLTILGPTFPTRTDYRSSTTIDIVLANEQANLNYHISPGPHTSSDHIPIVLKISNNLIQIPIKARRQYTKADWDSYEKHLGEMPTLSNNANPSVPQLDEFIEQWNKQVTEAMDRFIPLINHRTIPGVQPNEAILEARAQITFMQQIIASFGACSQAYRTINEQRRRISDEYSSLQKESWDSIVSNLQDEKDSSKFFSGIKRYMGNSKRHSIKISDNHGNFLLTPEEQEPAFRNHWKNVFRIDLDTINHDEEHLELVESTVSQQSQQLTPLANSNSTLDENFPPVSVEELGKIIKALRHKAPGPTGITAHALKHLPENMLVNLTFIFNYSLAIGHFPSCYKKAIMIFIPKGNPNSKTTELLASNHRPISLTEVTGKMLDSILNKRFSQHLTTNNLHHPDQHGFRPGRGCHTALACLHETLSKAHHENKRIGVILRDVSKAFDKVWTDGLKFKLLQSNLHPQLLRCLASYISDRQATISIGPHLGPAFQLESGVPQGGCLSPSLFNFFTRELPRPAVDGAEVTNIIYADDVTQIVTSPSSSRQVLHKKIEKAAKQLSEFEAKWLIKTNTSKFKVITNTTIGRPVPPPVIDGIPIQPCNTGQCLGLTFSLKGYGTHIAKKKVLCGKQLMRLYRFRKLSVRRKRHLYLSFIRPSLIYPATPLHAERKSNLKKLQVIQNRALKFILQPDTYHITAEELHRRAKLEPLNQVLHTHASKTWSTIKMGIPDMYAKLSAPFAHRTQVLLSSRKSAEADKPEPQYTYYGTQSR